MIPAGAPAPYGGFVLSMFATLLWMFLVGVVLAVMLVLIPLEIGFSLWLRMKRAWRAWL